MSEYRLIGKPVPRDDAWAKVRGEQAYSDDYALPGMLFGKVLRSAHAAAILKSVNTAKAVALDGVHAVLTADDVPNNVHIVPYGDPQKGGTTLLTKVMAKGRIRHKNEAIAIVAAESEEIADEALRLIDVEYEILPGVYDMREAVNSNYQVADEEPNRLMFSGVEKGDPDSIWDKCAVIVENDYSLTSSDHAYLETEGGVAWPAENGVIMMRVGSQILELYRNVAHAMNMPHNKVRNMSVPVGGGFGGKDDVTVETFLALLVKATRRPVKMIWTREESINVHSKRHAAEYHYKTGVDAEGNILAQKVDIIMDAGAYASITPLVQTYATINAPGCYNIPHVNVRCQSVLTNTIFGGANRGFGCTQSNLASELQIDEIAHKLNKDPVELRLKNCLKNGDAISTGFIPPSNIELAKLIEAVQQTIPPKGERPRYAVDGRKIGYGLACGMMSYGRLSFLHDTSRVAIRIEMDGSITIRAGVPDVGCGQASSLCQIAAEEFGLPMERIHAYIMDTHLTPLAGNTSATRQLLMSGNACLKAAHELRRELSLQLCEIWNCSYEDLCFTDGKIYNLKNKEQDMDFVKAVALTAYAGHNLTVEAQFNAPFTGTPDFRNIKGGIHPDITYTAHVAKVAVDIETGVFEVLDITAAVDAGRIINLHSCEGQMEGGAIYSMSYLTENLAYDKGNIRANNFSTYLLPTALDTPPIQSLLFESGSGLGPYGAKGVGEPAGNSIAPAIINAIFDATGFRPKRLPITPEYLLQGIKSTPFS